MDKLTERRVKLDRVMLGRFVAQYEEGADGFFIDADEAQEVALQIKVALSLGERIMDEVHNDQAIPTEVACKVYAAIKRANVAEPYRALDPEQALNMAGALRKAAEVADLNAEMYNDAVHALEGAEHALTLWSARWDWWVGLGKTIGTLLIIGLTIAVLNWLG